MQRVICELRDKMKSGALKRTMRFNAAVLAISVLVGIVTPWFTQDIMVNMYVWSGVLVPLYMLLASVALFVCIQILRSDREIRTKIVDVSFTVVTIAALTLVACILVSLALSSVFGVDMLVTNDVVGMMIVITVFIISSGLFGMVVGDIQSKSVE
jgi:hypothetical protein